MDKCSIIIIGAGLAGLSTGCYGQMNEYQTEIFEQHSRPGGLAAWWKRGNYLIDGGIHFLIGHKSGSSINDVYRELGTADPNSLIDMITYVRFVDLETNTTIDFSKDLDQLEHGLIAISPDDEKKIHKLIRDAKWLRDSPILMDVGMSFTPPELKSRLSSLKEFWQMRGFMRFLLGEYSKTSREYAAGFKSPFLRRVFENLFSPEAPFWFVLMILASVASGELGLLKGGCFDFVAGIVKRYESLGGKIHYRSKVEKIIVEENRAIGVILTDGSEHYADIIVSAADGHSTIFRLLNGEYVNERIIKQYYTWPKYDPLLMISLGVKRVFRDYPSFVAFLMKDPISIGNRQTSLLAIRLLNYGEKFAPEGHTLIQVMCDADWNYWKTLRENRDEYYKRKEQLAQRVVEELEQIFPGIQSQIDMIDVATPYTTWRYTLNHCGSPMGWQITKKSIMTQISRTLPGLENFYMAGQWVTPGGGVPPSILTGRNIIQILCKRNGKSFKTTKA